MIKEDIQRGDLVLSLRGRDKNCFFIVTERENETARIVDGKTHKSSKPKLKNIKHLKLVRSTAFCEVAERMVKGELVADKKIKKAINADANKYRRKSLCQKTT